jgi:hypothetical protein
MHRLLIHNKLNTKIASPWFCYTDLQPVTFNLALFCAYISLVSDTEALDIIYVHIYKAQRVIVTK